MLNGNKIVPVIVINNVEDTIPMLQGLLDGGINIAEITFRTECAKEAIELGRKTFPDMIIGAGTILNAKQAQDAINSGAMFIVSPGFDKETCDYLRGMGVTYIPGAVL